MPILQGLGPGSRGGRKGASVNLKEKFEKDLPSTEDSAGSDNDETKTKSNKKSSCRGMRGAVVLFNLMIYVFSKKKPQNLNFIIPLLG